MCRRQDKRALVEADQANTTRHPGACEPRARGPAEGPHARPDAAPRAPADQLGHHAQPASLRPKPPSANTSRPAAPTGTVHGPTGAHPGATPAHAHATDDSPRTNPPRTSTANTIPPDPDPVPYIPRHAHAAAHSTQEASRPPNNKASVANSHRWYERIQTDVCIRTKGAGRLLVCTASKRRQPSCSYSSQPCMVPPA